MKSRVFLVALLVLTVLPAVMAPTAASSPPEPVCGVCSDPFEGAAERAGIDLTVESSHLHVSVDDDGTGHWTALVEVDEQSAESFHENPDQLDSVVRQTLESHRVFVDDPQNLDSRIHDRTVIVTFDIPEMAYRAYGDVLLIDYFNADGNTRSVYVDADEFTVQGPDGTFLVNDPPRLHTGFEKSVTWIGGPEDNLYIDDETYLAFGPDYSLSTRIAADASIVADSSSYLIPDLVGAALVPTFLMGLGVVGIQYLTRRFDTGSKSVRSLGYLISGLGAVWVALVALGMSTDGLSAIAWTLGLQFVVLGLVAARRPDVVTFWRLVAAVVAPPVAVAALVSLSTETSQLWGVPSALSLGMTAALFLPFGYAARRGLEWRPFTFAIVAAPVVFTIQTLPIGGYGSAPVFMAILLSGWALLTLATGTLVYRLGWALGEETSEGSTPQSSGTRPQNHQT
ncbi:MULTISPECIES: hypothetical protein [Haloferax]|uniref:hypothetical protein n=1 Tax=Haloferax TaxID=2251 RepID=UPI001783C435|nr:MULTISPECIES: hypothetical protein [Haloferax]